MNKKNYISDKYKINRANDILDQDMQDEIIMLNLNNENYLGLDKVGARFWHILLNSKSTKDAYNQILGEYDVDSEVLENDMNDFIYELEKNGLIIIRST